MSARDAIMAEIRLAPEPLVQEAYDFILFLKSRRTMERELAEGPSTTTMPDFLERQKALFGSRLLPDSQVILDDLRAERF